MRIYSAPNRSGQVDCKTARVIAKRILRESDMSPQINKIALFIDGLNLYTTARSLGFEIDFKRLLREFQSRGYLLRAFYCTAVIKATKQFVDQTGRRKVKGNMDIELAVDAIELAPHIDQMVLFSGDGDFCCLVKAMQRRGVR